MMRVAHNLRAPLAAVLSMIDVFREGNIGNLNSDQTEYLRRIERRARNMLSMINELMTLSTNRSAKKSIEKTALDIEWLAGRLQRTFQDQALEKGLSFNISITKKLPPLWGNLEMLEQMFENLVSNAIKYTSSGGKVNVVFSQGSEKMLTFEVSDTGIGIPKDSIPRLFSEFFRAPNAKEIEEVGTGLGLAIVKEIVESHGGRINVESEEGCGTVFWVRLPGAPLKDGEHEPFVN